jgi:hypothetical protein
MNLDRLQCKKIMAPVFNYALPAMGICRNFPRALIFSTTLHAGIGIRHLHTIQEIARLKDVLQHKNDNTTTGQLYRTSLEYLILELGMGTTLHEINYKKFNALATNSLIKSTWEFLHSNNIVLNHDITVQKKHYQRPSPHAYSLPRRLIYAQTRGN